MEITVIMDKRRATAEGTFPILLRFASMGKKTTVALKIWAEEHEFDKRTGLLLTDDKKKRAGNNRHNAYITKEKSRAVELLQVLRMTGRDRLTPEEFRKIFSDKESEEVTLTGLFNDFIATKKGRTAHHTE